MTWSPESPQGNEAEKVKYEIVPYTRGRVLDLGCGPWKAWPHFIGVDNYKDTQLYNIQMKPDFPVEDACALPFVAASMDAVFSSHLLEHIEDHHGALAAWWSVIKLGGFLVLYLPHKNLYPNIGQEGANPDHKHDFVPQDIVRAMEGLGGWDLLVNETRSQHNEYSFLQVFRKRGDTLQNKFTKPEKSVCVVRYGGYGDQLQAASILPELKRLGYHVAFMTTPKGQDVLREDPHVDQWLIQDPDQVPNCELAQYWKVWASRFDRFINLSESIEGTLLAMPGRANHMWPDSVRRQRLNVNYMEWTAELAQLPYKSESRFYPAQEEKQSCEALLEHYGGRFNILWALAGSSVHKFYPWQDVAVQEILNRFTDAVIYFVGDSACKILESGWEDEPRIVRLSGELNIRGTLTLATLVHCVVGPETGVLNAVAFDPAIHKVVMLSHSSEKNLSWHWANTSTLAPDRTPCYPCHRLHYGREFCHEHESGSALCAANIEPSRVVDGVARAYAQNLGADAA